MPCLEKGDGGIVINGLGMHGAHEANVIRNPCGMWKKLTDFQPRFPVFFECILGPCQGISLLPGSHPGDPLGHLEMIPHILPEMLLKYGFVVEEVLLGRGAALKQVDHPFGLRGNMEAVQDPVRRILPLGKSGLFAKQGCQGGNPNPMG